MTQLGSFTYHRWWREWEICFTETRTSDCLYSKESHDQCCKFTLISGLEIVPNLKYFVLIIHLNSFYTLYMESRFHHGIKLNKSNNCNFLSHKSVFCLAIVSLKSALLTFFLAIVKPVFRISIVYLAVWSYKLVIVSLHLSFLSNIIAILYFALFFLTTACLNLPILTLFQNCKT